MTPKRGNPGGWLLAAAAFIAAAIYFFVALGPVRTWQGTFFFVFQARDLHRAQQILEGRHIFFGPEVTGGGNLLGPFYYYLLAAALAAWDSWMAVWGWLIALTAAAAAGAWVWFRNRLSAAAAWLWLGMFGSVYFSRVLIELFLNVSFLLCLAVVALICICESHASASAERRRRAFLAACVLLGLGIQLHFSVIVWLAALFSLRTFLRGPGRAPARPGELILGLACFVLPLLPFLAWRALAAFGFEFGQQNVFAGRTREALPTMIAFARNLAVFPFAETFSHSLRLAEVLPAPLLLLVPAALLWKRPGAGAMDIPEEKAEWLGRATRALLVCAAFGLIPFAYFFVAPIGRRYVIPLGVPVHFLAAVLFERVRGNLSRVRFFCALAVISLAAAFWLAPSAFSQPLPLELLAFFLGPQIVAAFAVWRRKEVLNAGWAAVCVLLSVALCQAQRALVESGYTSTGHVGVPRFVPNAREWQLIWSEVRSHTCWSYEEAIRRLYFVNHHLEQDARPGYDLAASGEECVAPGLKPDGFFVSILKRDPRQPKEWLLEANIQPELKQALRDGSLRVAERSLLGGMLMLPYWVDDTSRLPAFFHDTGQAYFRSEEDELVNTGGEAGEAVKLAEGRHVFRWNECPGEPAYCGTGALVSAEREGPQRWGFRVRVLGSTLSQISPWISPEWTASWRGPYFEVSCGGKWQRFELATSIGYEQAFGHRLDYPFDYNNSFVAPFERVFRVSCGSRPAALAVGRAGSQVENVTEKGRALPARRLEIRF